MQNLLPTIESLLASLPVQVSLRLPDGRHVGAADAQVALRFANWRTLAKLPARQIGSLAEDYVEGRIGIEGAMRDVIAVVTALMPGDAVDSDSGWWTRLLHSAKSRGAHSRMRDAEQIQFHYDVSDDFYALWLDPRRVYSCGYFRYAEMDVAAAQEAKLDHICRKLMLRPGERFLDIGCGWGALLLWAVEHYGVDATGITLSKNQHAHVQQLIDQRGLGSRMRVRLMDYRELEGETSFDKIASVGMFEHVGSANMARYFRDVQALLAPGGLTLQHGITAGQLDYRQLAAGLGHFIEKYIFPGGELLHVTRVLREAAAAGLEMLDAENLRPHYARTLWAWSDALESRLDAAREVLARGMDARRAERVLRAYRLYLPGSAMSFEQGWIALHQMLFTRPDSRLTSHALPGARTVYPFHREYMYNNRRFPCFTASSPRPAPTC